MMLRELLHGMFRKSARSRLVRRVAPHLHLRVERLEDRCLLSGGALDPTFGSGGQVTTDVLGPDLSIAHGVAITQPDEKILVAGNALNANMDQGFALARYNANGKLDPTFGNGGRTSPTLFNNGFNNANAAGVALQADGKIVIAGFGSGPDLNGKILELARYNADGSLDTSFGTGGTVSTRLPSGTFRNPSQQLDAVAIQADGSIVADGFITSPNNSARNDFLVVRYTTAGALDSSFGTGGVVETSFNGGSDVAFAIALQADGAIVAAGWDSTSGGPPTRDFALARYTTTGGLDTSFGTGGKVTTDFGADDVARGVQIQADGKIVAAGSTGSSGAENFALARYTTTGALDTSFGTGGKVTTDFGGDDVANALTLQADGKIVAVGSTVQANSPTGSDFALARYTTTGTLDTTFGTGGKVVTDFAGTDDIAYAVALRDNKIVAVGSTGVPGTEAFAVAVYNKDGSLAPSFNHTGLAATHILSSDSDIFAALALQADGKLLSAGTTQAGIGFGFAVARYQHNGALDKSFGQGGIATVFAGDNFGEVTGVAVQADGKILVSGDVFDANFNTDLVIERFNTDGTLDPTFGSGGRVVTTVPTLLVPGGASGLIVLGNGEIVVAGTATNGTTNNNDFLLAEYTAAGTLDPNFGSSGIALADFGNNATESALALTPAGNLIEVGSVQTVSGTNDFALAQFTPTGTLDPTFGTGGEVVTDFGPGTDNHALGVAVAPGGQIVVVGSTATSPGASRDFALAEYTAAGALDTSFGAGTGKVTTDFGGDDLATTVGIRNGAIVVGGLTTSSSGTVAFALAQYNSDGSLDTSFGTGGEVTTTFPNGTIDGGINPRLVIQNNGKIVMGGQVISNGPTGGDFGLARYLDGRLRTHDLDQFFSGQLDTDC